MDTSITSTTPVVTIRSVDDIVAELEPLATVTNNDSLREMKRRGSLRMGLYVGSAIFAGTLFWDVMRDLSKYPANSIDIGFMSCFAGAAATYFEREKRYELHGRILQLKDAYDNLPPEEKALLASMKAKYDLPAKK